MNKRQTYNLVTIIAGLFTAVIVLAGAVLMTAHAPSVFAQDTTTTTNGDAGGFVQCGNTAGNPCQIGHLFSAFVVIVNYLIAMAAFVAVVAIVFAGFMMVYSQGQEALKAAKGRLSGAIIGLVLVAAAFILINALFSGSLSIGVRDGASILSSPLQYIQNGSATSSQPSNNSNSNVNTNGNTGANTNTNTPKPRK